MQHGEEIEDQKADSAELFFNQAPSLNKISDVK